MSFGLLLLRLLHHRSLLAALVVVSTALVIGTSMALATISSSSRAAVHDSVMAEHANLAFSLQVVDPKAMVPVLQERPEVVPVRDTTSLIQDLSRTRTAPIHLREVGGHARVGVIVSGRHPAAEGEASVSRMLAGALNVAVGDDAIVDGRTVRVVGVTKDPADRNNISVVVSRPLAPSAATLWLSESDPYEDTALRPLLDDRAATLRTTSRLASERAAASTSGLPDGLDSVPLLLGALLVLVLTGMSLLVRPIALRDVQALEAVGMTSRTAWRLMVSAAAISVVSGVVLGVMAGVGTARAAAAPLSHSLGQDWSRIALPYSALGQQFLLILVSLLALLVLTAVARKLGRSVPTLPPRPAVLTVAALSCLVLTASGFRLLPASLAPWGGAVLALTMPVLTASLARRKASATVVFARHLGRQMLPVGTATCLLVFIGTYWPAVVTHNAAAAAPFNVSPQPRGSYLLTEVPSEAARTLLTKYRELGGRDSAEYILPVETNQSWRVTSPELVACLAESGATDAASAPDDCYPTATSAPVNRVLLKASGATEADPGLIIGGHVGLMKFSNADPGRLQGLAQTAAQGSDRLGGNLSGLVTADNGRVARKLGLKASAARLVALFDFAKLSPGDRAVIRALATRLAPTAQVSELAVDDDLEATQVSRVLSVGFGSLVLLLLTVVGTTVLAGQHRSRRTLADLTAAPTVWHRVARWWIGPVALGVAVSMVAGRSSAWIAGVHLPGSFGVAWVLPGSVAFATVLVLYVAFVRPPVRRPGD